MKFEKNNEPVYNLNYDLDRPHTPSPSESYFQNKYGIFNLIGNVSEIVMEDNIVVGGSWRDNDVLNWEKSTQEFTEPQDWIGFRCVCELK